MADAPDVRVKITAEDQGVSAAIKQLTAELQTLKAQEKETADASLSLKEAFTGILEVLAIEKLAEFGKEVFDTTTKILKLSQVTGLSTETLSVYASAATDAGVSFDEVGAGISKLAVVVTQFEQGNQKAAKAIALTGLSLKSLQGLNSEQKLRAITDAIGKMPAGFQKQTVETRLLGDSTGSLTKVMNSLAGDGFEKTREEAEKLGNIVGTQTAADFESLRSAIADMKEASEGVVRQFEAGLVPALTDITNAILRATTTDGASGFKTFGQVAGVVLKDIILLFTMFFGGLEKLVDGPIETVKNFAKFAEDTLTAGPIQAAKNLVANQAASQKFIDDLVDHQLTAVRTELDGLTRLQTEAMEKLKAAREKAKGKEGPIENQEEIKGLLKLQEQQDAAFKAHTTMLNKALDAEQEISKSFQAQREEGAKSEFDRGLISLTEYFDSRRLEIEAAGVAELETLRAKRENEVKAEDRASRELTVNRAKARGAGGVDTIVGQEFQAAAAKNLADQQRARQAIADLDTKITVQTNANKTKLVAEDLSRYKTEEEQLTKLTAFRKTVLDLQGKTAEAAKIEADAKEAEYRLLLASQPGATAASIDAEIAKYRELTAAAGEFEQKRKEGEAALKTLTDARAEIEDRVKSGKLFQIQADEKIEDLEKDQLANLQLIAAAQLKAATATGNQANIAQAKDFQRQVNAIAIESQAALTDMAKIKTSVQQGLVGSFQTFFDTGIIGARNVAQAFAGLADGIVSSMRKAAGAIVTTALTSKLLSAIPGLSGKDKGAAGAASEVAAAAAKGAAEAAPLTAAAGALTVGGTTIAAAGPAVGSGAAALGIAGGTLLTGAAAVAAAAIALQAAADTLLIANSAGGGGYAEGGMVSGPGTGTSDSIAARLSAGEFVMREAAVRAIGPGVLAAMNRGLRAPAINLSGNVPRFAEGGLVEGSGKGDPARIHLQLGLDEGIVVKHMSSRAAGKVVVQHLANNPKQAAKAIGRSA